MKKRFTAIAILMTMVMGMAGCGGGPATMSLEITNEKAAEITLNNADVNENIVSGTIAVGEGEGIEIKPELQDGSEVSIELAAVSGDESADKNQEFGEADFEVILNSNDEIKCVVDSGSYQLRVTALTKSNGTISLNVQSAETVEESSADMDEADVLVPVEEEDLVKE